jgi:Tfp pilus assembly protein PilW
MRFSLRTNQRGYGTAEILAATTIALVASAAFVKFNHYQMHVVQDQAKQLALQDMARSAVDVFAREIRRAGQNPTCAGGIIPLVSATSNMLRIQADVDGNGTLAATNEDVMYVATSTAFSRVTNSLADTLVTGVTTSASFRYYDGAGVELVPARCSLAPSSTTCAAFVSTFP